LGSYRVLVVLWIVVWVIVWAGFDLCMKEVGRGLLMVLWTCDELVIFVSIIKYVILCSLTSQSTDAFSLVKGSELDVPIMLFSVRPLLLKPRKRSKSCSLSSCDLIICSEHHMLFLKDLLWQEYLKTCGIFSSILDVRRLISEVALRFWHVGDVLVLSHGIL